MPTSQAETEVKPSESAEKQSPKRASTTTYAEPEEIERDCPGCGTLKHLFIGPLCLGCWTAKIGERIEWAKCPKCAKEWSKLCEGETECIDCNEKAGADKTKEAEMFKRLKKLFGSEKSIKELTLENFSTVDGTEEGYEAATLFDPAKNNLYLWGPTGRGKTHLAYAVAQKWLRLGKGVEILTTRELINRFRLTKPDEEVENVRYLVAVPVLVIDDLGVQSNSDFALDILCDILNKRGLADRNGLIVTSNLFLSDLAKKNQDDRLSSRLSGMCRIVNVDTSEDWRSARRY